MTSQRSEIYLRLVRFLSQDRDGLRRMVVQSIIEMKQFTVLTIHDMIAPKVPVSKKVIASMIGYICSRLGILHVNKTSYKSPMTYALKEEYAEIARRALLTCGKA